MRPPSGRAHSKTTFRRHPKRHPDRGSVQVDRVSVGVDEELIMMDGGFVQVDEVSVEVDERIIVMDSVSVEMDEGFVEVDGVVVGVDLFRFGVG